MINTTKMDKLAGSLGGRNGGFLFIVSKSCSHNLRRSKSGLLKSVVTQESVLNHE